MAVGGLLLAIGLQVWQFTQLPFFPGSSGYASCFIGWAVMNIILLLGGLYWLETNLAAVPPAGPARPRGGLTGHVDRCRWPSSSGPTWSHARTSSVSWP